MKDFRDIGEFVCVYDDGAVTGLEQVYGLRDPQ
jgi:hypothetical protein